MKRLNFFFLSVLIVFSNCTSEQGKTVQIQDGIVKGETGKQIDLYLTRITPFGFSGTALVAKDGEILLNKGYGMAIESEGIPNSADTVLSTGSITKQFTAAAILKLEMQGKLRTEDFITKFFDNVPKDKSDITIHSLLTHTAGMIGYTGNEVSGDFEKTMRDETIQMALDAPLLFEPGEDMRYSNAGYSVLAAIIEKASGQSYEEYLRENLFKPAGMESTGYILPDWGKKIVAHYYEGETDFGTFLEQPYPSWHLLGNGGILSTTSDMYRWHLALEGDEILSSSAKTKLYTPFLNNYAYGWDVTETDQGTLIQHNGGGSFTDSADYLRFIDAGVVISMFCNREYEHLPLSEYLTPKIARIVFGGAVDMPPELVSLNAQECSKYIGTYTMSNNSSFVIFLDAGDLKIRPVGQESINAFTYSASRSSQDYEAQNRISLEVVEALFAMNFNPLVQASRDEAQIIQLIKMLERRIPEIKKNIGKIQDIEVKGTVPKVIGSYNGGSYDSTVVHIIGHDANLVLQFIWEEGNLIDISRIRTAIPLEISIRPISEKEFCGYHLFMAKNSFVSFDTNANGQVTRMKIKKDGEVFTALKTK